MADYYACTELEPLLDEIRTCFREADANHESLTLTISNAGDTYRYVLKPDNRTGGQNAYEVAGQALDMLRNGLATATCVC